ncbi:MAG: transglycosylase domain-containing protein [Acidaminococcaceae bacterium]|nr:transglycosylase domain-containing protein [Acidaminococcaceae bacterium]
MFKILVLIIAAVSIFFWYPASGDPIQKDVVKPAPQHTVQQSSEHSQATVFLLSLLPPKQEWPDPVQKIWLSLNIEEAVQERTNDINWVPITEIPIEMQQALLAIEDHNFYSHGAIDIDGILRAALVNITAREVVQGGSTITQQLTKNLFLSQEQTLSRKAEEALLALVMEQHYSKDQLLEIYFNTTYFGAGATGLKAAALTYFAKQPQELQLAECAVIASLPYAPSALNPLENP